MQQQGTNGKASECRIDNISTLHTLIQLQSTRFVVATHSAIDRSSCLLPTCGLLGGLLGHLGSCRRLLLRLCLDNLLLLDHLLLPCSTQQLSVEAANPNQVSEGVSPTIGHVLARKLSPICCSLACNTVIHISWCKAAWRTNKTLNNRKPKHGADDLKNSGCLVCAADLQVVWAWRLAF